MVGCSDMAGCRKQLYDNFVGVSTIEYEAKCVKLRSTEFGNFVTLMTACAHLPRWQYKSSGCHSKWWNRSSCQLFIKPMDNCTEGTAQQSASIIYAEQIQGG